MLGFIVSVFYLDPNPLPDLRDGDSIADSLVVVFDPELGLMKVVTDVESQGDMTVDKAVEIVAVQRAVGVFHVIELHLVNMRVFLGLRMTTLID